MIECNRYLWKNLELKIRERIITPLKSVLQEPKLSELIKIEQTIIWHSLPIALGKLHTMIIDAVNDCSSTQEPRIKKYIWYNLNKQVENLCSLADQLEECESLEINFDITGNWIAKGIETAQDLEDFLNTDNSGIEVTNFSLINGRLKALVSGVINLLNFNNFTFTEIKTIDLNYQDAELVFIVDSELAVFNPNHKFQEGLIYLSIQNSSLTEFNLDYPLPISIVDLEIIAVDDNPGIGYITGIDNTLINLAALFLYNNTISSENWEALNSWALVAPIDGELIEFSNNLEGTSTYDTLINKTWTINLQP